MLNKYNLRLICTKDGCETITEIYTMWAESFTAAKNRLYQKVHADYHPNGYSISITECQ